MLTSQYTISIHIPQPDRFVNIAVQSARMASALESLHDHDIASFVFMDLESTDLLCTRTRITELCLVAVNRLDLQGTGIFPRVTNKLTICLDPVKPVSASASVLTGLYNDTLECQKPFSCETVQLLTCFLQNLAKPVCLLAHNGNKFDFPLLMQELKRISMSLDATLLCADTLEAFRALDGWEPAGGKVPCICQFCIQCRNNRTPSREPVKPEPLAPMKRKLINGARSQDERVKIRRLEEQVNTSPVSRYQRELTINDTNNNARRTLVFGAERNAENSEENVDGRDFQLSKARCRRKLSFGDKQKETNAELEKGESGENCVLNKMLDGSENERKPGELDSQFSVGMEDDIYLEALENVEKQLGISETKDIEYESSKPDQEEKKTDFGVKNIETENDTNATLTGRVEQSEIKLSTGPKTFGEANMMEVTEETVEQVGGS
ncbi:TREX2-like protein, partial [Mya arenaria]